jgi:transposase
MTTTTDVAVIDEPSTDVEVVEPLTKSAAKALDKKVRAASDKLGSAADNLMDLLEQAAAGNIHEALELPSWTAWFKDAVQVTVSDRHERKTFAILMSGKGMSQRAIAGALGVSQKTVDRDLADEEVEEGATVTSLDGAQRPKVGKSKAEEPQEDSEEDFIDAEVVEEDADDEPEPMTAAQVVEAFNDETANLWAAHSELKDLLREEKWGGARKRVAAANLNHIQEVATALQAIVDDLMTTK